jgi:hypothetical protein
MPLPKWPHVDVARPWKEHYNRHGLVGFLFLSGAACGCSPCAQPRAPARAQWLWLSLCLFTQKKECPHSLMTLPGTAVLAPQDSSSLQLQRRESRESRDRATDTLDADSRRTGELEE